MSAHFETSMIDMTKWQSLVSFPSSFGYSVSEHPDRFKREAAVEVIIRCVAILIVFGAYFQWFLPSLIMRGDPAVAKAVLSIVFAGTGLGLYVVGTRGFLNELTLNMTKQELRIGKLNGQGRNRIARHIALDRVESMFVKRPSERQAPATLYLRLAGKPRAIAVLRGHQSEVEALHMRLCQDIQFATQKRAVVRPQRPPSVFKPQSV
ncbi:MAG: hypothetical protein HKP40_02520 [Litoreibacter sp.]|nr:hypothetical protein [Litoreibacter sp.]